MKATDVLWDAQCGIDPMVAAAMTQCSRSPAPARGKKNDKKSGNAYPKSHPPSRPDFYSSRNPGNGMCKISQLPEGSQVYFTLCLVGKLKSRRTLTGSAVTPAHATATAMHFPANAGLIFLTDDLTHDRYLVDTGATLSIVPCIPKPIHLAPCSRGQMDNQSPLGDLF